MSAASCRLCGGGVEECACLLQRGRGLRCGVAADLNCGGGFPGTGGMFVQAAAVEEEPSPSPVGAAAVGLQEFQFFGQEEEDHEMSVAWLFNDHAPVGGEDRPPPATEQQRRRCQAFDAYAEYVQPGHGLTFDVPVPVQMPPLTRGVVVDAAGLGLAAGNPVTSGAAIVSDALLREIRNAGIHGRHSGELRHRPERRRGGAVNCVRQRRSRRRVLGRRRRGCGAGGAAGGEADAVQGEAEAAAVREADPVRVPQGLRRDAPARERPLRQGARRRRRPSAGKRAAAAVSAAAGAGRRGIRPRPARPGLVPFVANDM